jgi:hypothetical protein
MTDQTVPPTGYARTAAELRRIADALDTLPPVSMPPYVQVSILPERTTSAVDAVAQAVLGRPGRTERISGDWYHVARGTNFFAANVHVTVQARVPAPPDDRDAEIERLRAELVGLRSAVPGPDGGCE